MVQVSGLSWLAFAIYLVLFAQFLAGTGNHQLAPLGLGSILVSFVAAAYGIGKTVSRGQTGG